MKKYIYRGYQGEAAPETNVGCDSPLEGKPYPSLLSEPEDHLSQTAVKGHLSHTEIRHLY